MPHEAAGDEQSDLVLHGGSAGMNLLMWTSVNSLACSGGRQAWDPI
jgi:hypothetical protein